MNETNIRPPAKAKFVAKGHDVQLQDAQYNNIPVKVELISDLPSIEGNVVRRDKYTITVREFDCLNEVLIYKHAIATIVLKRHTAPVQQ